MDTDNNIASSDVLPQDVVPAQDKINYKLEVFEGPLDLLLTLISKHKLKILDIEISVLLEQFLLYLDKMQEADMEIAGEFIEMAARLIFIKSAALLPKAEVIELKKELSGALIEYALCKEAAERLAECFKGFNIFVRKQTKIDMDMTYSLSHKKEELLDAYKNIVGREKRIITREQHLTSEKATPRSFVSVFSKVIYVLRNIKNGELIQVNSLYKGQTRSEKVAIFLALLELSKYSRIGFSDDNRYLRFLGKEETSA